MKQLFLCWLVVLTAGGLSAQSTTTTDRADEIRTSLRAVHHLDRAFDLHFRQDLRFFDFSLPQPAVLLETGARFAWGDYWSTGLAYRHITAPDPLESPHQAHLRLQCTVPLRSLPISVQSRTLLIQQFDRQLIRAGGQFRHRLRLALSDDFDIRPFGEMEVFYQIGHVVGLQRTRYALGSVFVLSDRIQVDVSATRQRTKFTESLEGRMIYALTGRYVW